MGSIDTATWSALALVLTVVGMAVSVLVWRRRGAAAGIRGFAWSLLPVAAALTGTLRLLWRVADEVVSWAVRLVFSPTVWLGLLVLGVSVALFVTSAVLRRTGVGTRGRSQPSVTAPAGSGRAPARATPSAAVDPELAEIESILKRRGIS
jgi:hypothetical protein